MKEIIRDFAKHFNATVTEWLGIVYWNDYAAHFSCKDVEEGIYDDIEAMQGKDNTYYAGEVIACGLNAAQVEFGYDLVKRFFA